MAVTGGDGFHGFLLVVLLFVIHDRDQLITIDVHNSVSVSVSVHTFISQSL